MIKLPTIPDDVRHRVMRALADEELSACAHQVLQRLIKFPECAGRDNAISIGRIQAWAKINSLKVYSDREIKAAARELIELGVPVGSARTEPYGYYLAVTPEDLEEAERPIVNEIRSLAKRLRCMNPNSQLSRALCGQLGIGEEADDAA